MHIYVYFGKIETTLKTKQNKKQKTTNEWLVQRRLAFCGITSSVKTGGSPTKHDDIAIRRPGTPCWAGKHNGPKKDPYTSFKRAKKESR